MMKTLQQILFTLIVVTGLSLAVSAQKGEKPPPKEKPPKIDPKPKDPPKPKPQKPGMAFFIALPTESEYAE